MEIIKFRCNCLYDQFLLEIEEAWNLCKGVRPGLRAARMSRTIEVIGIYG